MTTYTTITQESNSDLTLLGSNSYQLQVAKSVAGTDGSPSYNVVFKSHYLAAQMNVAWTTTYGLNWTKSIDAPGVSVSFGGDWQQCGLGDSYSLDSNGLWVPVQPDSNTKANSLNVGSNGYASDVHIIVGVQDQSGTWVPIWVSPSALLVNANGAYEPLEYVSLWFQEGTQSSTMISEQSTPVLQQDMSEDTTLYFSYDAGSGDWKTPQVTAFNFPPSPSS